MATLKPRYRNAADKAAGRISGYCAVFYDPLRRPAQKHVTLRTKSEATARRRLTAMEKKYDLGNFDPWTDAAPENGVSVDDAVKRYLRQQRQAGRAPETVETAKWTLEAFAASLPALCAVRHVEPRHVAAFLNKPKLDREGKPKGPKAAATKNRYHAVIQHFAGWAVKKGLCAANFAASVETPTARANRREHLTTSEEEAVIRKIRAAEVLHGRSYEWLVDWIVFGTRTGLRPGEQRKLRWSAVRLDEGTVRVGKGHRTKTTKSARTIPLPAAALDVLRRRAAGRAGEGDGPVFTLPGGGPVELRYLSKRLEHYGEEAEVEKHLTSYCLRHSYGTRLALAGTPLFIIAKLMGTSVAMIEKHYGHYAPEHGAAHVERVFAEAAQAVEALKG